MRGQRRCATAEKAAAPHAGAAMQSRSRHGVYGLGNGGNRVCWVNAVMQGLLAAERFGACFALDGGEAVVGGFQGVSDTVRDLQGAVRDRLREATQAHVPSAGGSARLVRAAGAWARHHEVRLTRPDYAAVYSGGDPVQLLCDLGEAGVLNGATDTTWRKTGRCTLCGKCVHVSEETAPILMLGLESDRPQGLEQLVHSNLCERVAEFKGECGCGGGLDCVSKCLAGVNGPARGVRRYLCVPVLCFAFVSICASIWSAPRWIPGW